MGVYSTGVHAVGARTVQAGGRLCRPGEAAHRWRTGAGGRVSSGNQPAHAMVAVWPRNSEGDLLPPGGDASDVHRTLGHTIGPRACRRS